MRIALAQIDPVVGAFEQNFKLITEAYKKACSVGADLLMTPELSVCGYPPHDLVDRAEMFERNEQVIKDLLKLTRGQNTVLAVGHIAANPDPKGRAAQNVISLIQDGKVVFRQAKTLLPTYDVFDEARYFEPATSNPIWEFQGIKIAVAICEDLWARDPALGRQLYGIDPTQSFLKQGAQLVLSFSASPYEFGKLKRRIELHAETARLIKAPLIYLNQTGATDEILFDGASFGLQADGSTAGMLPVFGRSFGLIELHNSRLQWLEPDLKAREDQVPSDLDILSRGLVTGIKEYFVRTGFKSAILGLSGGVDSALVATLAVRALGAQNVLGVAMPSQHSSGHSLEDAEVLARNLGIRLEVRPIKFLNSTAARELSDRRGQLNAVALENLQSRLRGLILMTLSNHDGSLVLTTGNKSELATGYCTLYGDMAGALAPLGDLLKTRVYELCQYINKNWNAPIPERTLTKAPSAELRPGQVDQDSLPPYDQLDAFLTDYLERNVPAPELQKKYPSFAQEMIKKVEVNEYKRRQAAPVIKITNKAFGIGRRIPIAKKWNLGII